MEVFVAELRASDDVHDAFLSKESLQACGNMRANKLVPFIDRALRIHAAEQDRQDLDIGPGLATELADILCAARKKARNAARVAEWRQRHGAKKMKADPDGSPAASPEKKVKAEVADASSPVAKQKKVAKAASPLLASSSGVGRASSSSSATTGAPAATSSTAPSVGEVPFQSAIACA